MVLGELDLLHNLLVKRSPYSQQIQKGRCCLECVCCLSASLVCPYCIVCSIKGRQPELFDVGFSCDVVRNSVLGSIRRLEGLKLVHEGGCVHEAFLVCIVKLAAEDLIDDPVVAPVGYNGFGGGELSCAEGEALDVERGEGGG